jgi:PAP2 superfamily
MSLRKIWTKLRFYDRLSLGYLCLTLLLAVFFPPTSVARLIPIRERILVSHPLIALTILALIYFTQVRSRSARHRHVYKWLTPVRDLYPFFLFTFVLFGEFTYLANAVFPYWIESYLIDFDFWLFKQPAHRFIETHAPAWMIEVMAFAYWSYYPLIAFVALRHYFARAKSGDRPTSRQRRERGISGQANPVFLDFMNRICFSFYICYVLFMLLPARSPRHALDLNGQLQLTGGFFFDLISQAQNYVSVVGAAFPSSHVAVAWVAAVALRRSDRYIFFIFLPVVVALTFSVFILQYHYVLDAVSGAVVAWLMEWIWRKRSAPNGKTGMRNQDRYLAMAISDDPPTFASLRK